MVFLPYKFLFTPPAREPYLLSAENKYTHDERVQRIYPSSEDIAPKKSEGQKKFVAGFSIRLFGNFVTISCLVLSPIFSLSRSMAFFLSWELQLRRVESCQFRGTFFSPHFRFLSIFSAAKGSCLFAASKKSGKGSRNMQHGTRMDFAERPAPCS